MTTESGSAGGQAERDPQYPAVDRNYGNPLPPDETRGWSVTSPVMPDVVEGPLTPPPLTAPTPSPSPEETENN